MRRVALLAPLAPLALLCAACGDDGGGLGPSEPDEVDPASNVVFEMTDSRIRESSGLAASRKHDGVFWTHNDMDNDPLVFAVSSETGETVATMDLDTTNVDWEDIAVTDSGVWVADIGGGEAGERQTVTVLRFEEPDELSDASPELVEYSFTYEDEAHNAEALLVDPRTDQLYVATKEGGGGALYAAPRRLSEQDDNILARIADAPPNVTGGSWAPDGPGFVLRNYPRAFVYAGLGRGGPTVVDLPSGPPRGESVVLLEDGDLLVGSEGRDSTVVRVDSPVAGRSE